MNNQSQENIRQNARNELDLDPISTAYNQAIGSVLIVHHELPDRLRLTGPDRLDILERLTSNSFTGRQEGDFVQTALLEANGRMIDLLDVFIHEDDLLISVSPGLGQNVYEWLARHIFFQDDVQVELVEPWKAYIGVYGPEAESKLTDLLGERPALAPGAFQQSAHYLILPIEWPNLTGFELYGQASGGPSLFSRWERNHPGSPAHFAFEALRIEAGIPRRGHEIVSGIIPLEARLTSTVSFTKGCYIGQEVIARLESRGQIASTLTGIYLSGAAAQGADLIQDGKNVGKLTSVAHSPNYGWIGLGFIKTRRWDPEGADVSIEGETARLQDLPFVTV